MEQCHHCTDQAAHGKDGCPLLNAAYILAGLAMMLNIRLSYSSAPYALIRFQLPENLFSVFVRRMASALELWCLPSMLLGNIMDIAVKAAYDGKGGSKNNEPTTTDKQVRFGAIIIPSILTQWLNFITYVVLLIVYRRGGDQGRLTTFYWVIAISGVVFGINMTLVYAADYNYVPVYIAGENSFPAITSFIHYITTLIFGNRRKYNSDFLIVTVDIWVAIIISFVAALVWTVAYGVYAGSDIVAGNLKHIYALGFFSKPEADLVSPCLMVIVGMGLVYAIYPGISPGMIVPFYLIDKIEMVLLIATIFPPVIIAFLRRFKEQLKTHKLSILQPTCKWGRDEPTTFDGNSYTWKNSGQSTDASGANRATDALDAWHWHAFDLLIVIKITLAAIFIYCLHYRESNLSRTIINQPKMSTFLSITFYMCHEILLALGFAGVVGDNGGGDMVLIPQYIGALFMIFLAFYSEGYIIEYKSHDPAHWPTDGMWYLYGYYQLNPNFFIMIMFSVCYDG